MKPTELDKWNDVIRENGFFSRIGWYDDAAQQEPTHDPPHDGPCMACGETLKPPVKTISLMVAANANRSYFYRAHKACYESNPEAADMKALDLIEAQRHI